MGFDPTNFNPSEHGSDNIGEAIPPGEYVMTVRGFSRHVRRGKNQIDFVVKAVLNNKRQRISSEYSAVWETVTIQQNAIWRLSNLCTAVGHTTPFNIDDDRQLSGAVKGKPFKAKIIHETYNGEKKARIKGYLNMAAEDVKAFDEALEDMAIDDSTSDYGDSSGSGYSGTNSESNNDGDFTDDDIPF